MQTFKYLFPILLSVSLLLPLVSCDDDPASAGDSDDVEASEVPEMPPFNEMQMKTDMFSQQAFSIAAKVETAGPWYPNPDLVDGNAFKKVMSEEMQFEQSIPFLLASNVVMAYESINQHNLSLLSSFFSPWAKEEAELSDGEFVWTYDVEDPENGETFSVNVAATTTNGEVNWNVIAELDAEEGGFEEQQIMEGTSALDGSNGEWEFSIDMPEESIESGFTWVYDGENLTEMELDLSTVYHDNYADITGNYELDGNTARIYDATIDTPDIEEVSQDLPIDVDLSATIQIEWDIETEDGSITIGEDNFCWDEEKTEVDC